jgi:hypothetical protein
VSNPLPPRPDLVLRVAFAGAASLPSERPLASALENVLAAIAAGLAAIDTSRTTPREDGLPRVSTFYSDKPPCIRVISGLAEGADALAVQVVEKLSAANSPAVRWEAAAVLAFPKAQYRDSRPAAYQPRFEASLSACAYVVELDGIYDSDNPTRRHRGYRGQATVLLRQADLLVAMTDVSTSGKAGGTQETIRQALTFGLPVVLIDIATAETRLVEPGQDFDDVVSSGTAASALPALPEVISTLLADPDIPSGRHPGSDERARHEYGTQLLEEFFDRDTTPPVGRDGRRTRTFRESVWRSFENRFSAGEPTSGDIPLAAYRAFRDRATSLNRHYTGLYRGAFLLNYRLAVMAVFLAALSLVILAGGADLVIGLLPGVNVADPAASAEARETWRHALLGLLGLAKLGIVVAILVNTRQANKNRWNDRAVDYRYLAERLRTLYYLPLTGSVQPAPSAPGYSSRIVRQSAADWLFEAIARHVTPSAVAASSGGSGTPPMVVPAPAVAVNAIREHWLATQRDYHDKNHRKMRSMFRWMENVVRYLNIAVIVFVAADLAIVIAGLFHAGPDWLHGLTPWLVFLAALLPAAVASANGIRFQSECQRLAERSEVMVKIIDGRIKQASEVEAAARAASSNPATNPGAWTPSALRLAEAVAADMSSEAAEWSVLYAKEIVET